MTRLRFLYDRKMGRVEIVRKGSDTPIATLYPEDFADFLKQVYDFVDRSTPPAERKAGKISQYFHSSMRKESWKWIGGVVKQKVSNLFKR